MDFVFLDTIALVKNYAAEPGSKLVQELLVNTPGERIHIAAVTGVEFLAAMQRKIKTGALTADAVTETIKDFREVWRDSFVVLDVDDPVIDKAMELAQKHGLRGYDAIQLACAVGLRAIGDQAGDRLTLWSTDEELLEAAKSEGLDTFAPSA